MKILICGGGGFIGGHLAYKLYSLGHYVICIDIKQNEYYTFKSNLINNQPIFCDDFIIGDLRDPSIVSSVIDESIDEIYQLAADMGGATYIFTGENDANIMHNSCLINLNVLNRCSQINMLRKSMKLPKLKVFYSSSACVYPMENQLDTQHPDCREDTTYPANPDSEYGWEKLFAERLYLTFARNYDIEIRIGRFHNIYGPNGTWFGGREKAPAALCRKVALCSYNNTSDTIDILGNGVQTRSFLYIDDCINAILTLMNSNETGPFNIGSEEMISINKLAELIIQISAKQIKINNILDAKCIGVNGRNSNNELIRSKLGLDTDTNPYMSLKTGLQITYEWIYSQINFSDKRKNI